METVSHTKPALEIMLRGVIYWAFQPLLIIAALALAYFETGVEWHSLLSVAALLVIAVLEYAIPARKEWRKSLKEMVALFGFIVLALFAYGVIEAVYEQSVFKWFESLRQSLGLDIWPSDWPVLFQVFLIFISYEFVNYWYHRGSHQWGWLWRISGHGTHHAFKKLGALNAVANHPIEAIYLILPRAIVGFLLGGEAVGAAFISLATVTALLAHANLELNSKVIGWFFTTNRYHIHHHSQVVSESNTNYGCVCIVWDRLFGTFQDADTKDTGIGPEQPTYKEMLLMPFKR